MRRFLMFFLLFFSFSGISFAYIQEDVVFCTDDARMCDDGTWVGRSWPNCEFVCPLEEKDIELNNCPNTIFPVCWKDNKTYSNSCRAKEVGVAYEWQCLANNFATKLTIAWKDTTDSITKDFSEAKKANLYLAVIKRAWELVNNTDSKLYISAYNYLRYISEETLKNNIYTPYIKYNLPKIALEDAILGGRMYVTNIDWLDLNKAIIYYEDWHITWSSKINITISKDEIILNKEEFRFDREISFNGRNLLLTTKIPLYWKWYYDVVEENNPMYKSLVFNYIANKERNRNIFMINFYVQDTWDEFWWNTINNIKIKQIDDIIISYNISTIMPYKIDENISYYTMMKNDVEEIIKLLEID